MLHQSARAAVVGAVFTVSALAAFAFPAAAQEKTAEDCAALRDLVIDAGYVTSARVVPALEDTPAYCEVRARALPDISIEVRLPTADWNGKFYQTGCGGFCGVLGRADSQGGFINAMGPGLKRGYATATSDSGHHGLHVLDAGWAHDNPHAERDWGWRSIGETNRVAQAAIDAFYGGAPAQSYFQGCSTGGRMAHMATLRYPEMFSGVISGAPAMDYTGLVATKMAWITQANTDAAGEQILKPGKEALIGAEVMRQCDGADGAEDGLIADPRACSVDLKTMRCPDGGPGAECLSDAELGVVAAWRQGPRNAAGEQLYPGGIPEGSEPFWWLWLTGKEGGGGKLVPAFSSSFGAYMAFADDPGPEWTPLDFDFERDPPRLSTMASVYNADDPDIGAFRAAGGKLIVWHGWADAIVTPYKTVDWYDKAAAAAGGEATLRESARLFMIPGMDHCGLLPGPGGVNQFSIDPLTALERWVEDGVPPADLALAE
ncbi:MAG: tannase/feruloyl esterase family alpha/beta hydrolase [Marivibrio sp.]|uniref:tannase/feruloyl esterase family alpha/beta hydrolase n=1 Tax=Marivibrio sp. TaxID=2039719 RepID=UPI0032EB28D3